MALDTSAKRAAAAGLPFPLGVGVEPGSLTTDLGVAAAGWSYWPTPFIPPTGGGEDSAYSVGDPQRIGVSSNPSVGWPGH